MENNEKKDFKKKGKTLIVCMVAAIFLCPIACDRDDILWVVSGADDVTLPSYSSWKKGVYGQDDKVYLFMTYGSQNSGTLTVNYADMPVSIKGNKMYDKVGEFVGKIRKKSNGDIVIFASNMPSLDINGTYKKVK